MHMIGFMAESVSWSLRQFQGTRQPAESDPKPLAAVHNMPQDAGLPTIPDAHGPSCRPDPSHLLSV